MSGPVWLVGRNRYPSRGWEVLGIYTRRADAVARCTCDTDWVGPAELDQDFGDASHAWPGAWYPHLADPSDQHGEVPGV